MNNYFLKGSIISLRAISYSDKGLFLRWYNDPDIRKNVGGIIPFGEAEFTEACHMIERVNPSSLWFSICDVSTQAEERLLGICGLHQIKYIQRNAEISILIGENDDRNRGIGTQCLELMEEYAFGTLQLHRLYARIFSDNEQSLRLIEKCGWRREGLLRDAAFWDSRYRDVYVYGKLETDR